MDIRKYDGKYFLYGAGFFFMMSVGSLFYFYPMILVNWYFYGMMGFVFLLLWFFFDI